MVCCKRHRGARQEPVVAVETDYWEDWSRMRTRVCSSALTCCSFASGRAVRAARALWFPHFATSVSIQVVCPHEHRYHPPIIPVSNVAELKSGKKKSSVWNLRWILFVRAETVDSCCQLRGFDWYVCLNSQHPLQRPEGGLGGRGYPSPQATPPVVTVVRLFLLYCSHVQMFSWLQLPCGFILKHIRAKSATWRSQDIKTIKML